MNWFHRIKYQRLGELVESVIRSRSNSRRAESTRQRRPVLEELETRLAPAVAFDAATGLLTVLGDENGPRDDAIAVSIVRDESADRNQFIAVTINGEVHSSKPGSKQFDAALAGATQASVLTIHVQGLDGNDTLRLGRGFREADDQVTVDGGAGDDRILGSGLSEVLLGGLGDDFISGGRGNDSVVGGAANDTLLGGAGDDTLVTGGGIDILDGGGGNNELQTEAAVSNVTFDPATGLLSVMGDQNGITNDRMTVRLSVNGFVEVEINGGLVSADPSSVRFQDALLGATQSTVTSIVMLGLDGNDSLGVRDAFPAANERVSISGGAGNDTLVGSPVSDFLDGGEGNDTLTGSLGDDTLDAGPGDVGLVRELADVNFILSNGSLNGLGEDVLIGITAANLVGGISNNTLDASGFTLGSVTLGGAGGADLLIGSLNGDALGGGGGSDTIFGGDGPDDINGGDDGDSLMGEAGDDTLDDDFLLPFPDTLVGGTGADIYRVTVVDGSTAPISDEFTADAEDTVLELIRIPNLGYHAVGGHATAGESCHFSACLADGHHLAWVDRDTNTTNVIDIWYDFRNETNQNTNVTYTNNITTGQRTLAVSALDLWEAATNNVINFVQNTNAARNEIINIGTGDLAAAGDETSAPGGVLGLGGPGGRKRDRSNY